MKRMFFSLCAGAVAFALAPQFPATATAQSKETVIFRFDRKDGAIPVAGLIDVNGTLYGTTQFGGAHCQGGVSCGTVFALDPSTDTETVLYSFCRRKNCVDGQGPTASLIDMNGTLYGTTLAGGTVNCSVTGGYLGCGTVFALDAKTNAETVLHSFRNGGRDGAFPNAALIGVNGAFYGTTSGGGTNCQNNGSGGCGTIFSIDPTTGTEAVLYSFCAQKKCLDGSEPYAGLIDVNGTLYGTTIGGGTYGAGAAFAFDVQTGAEAVLHSFGSNGDGTLPWAGLIDVKSTLYGTTVGGGAYGNGTVFSLDPATGVETVLYAFCGHPINRQCRDGDNPVASLIDVKGTLYGTTPLGGVYQLGLPGNGVLFALDPNTGAETVLDAFRSRKAGANSGADLINVTGVLYGTTAGGGHHDDGTVFSLKP